MKCEECPYWWVDYRYAGLGHCIHPLRKANQIRLLSGDGSCNLGFRDKWAAKGMHVLSTLHLNLDYSDCPHYNSAYCNEGDCPCHGDDCPEFVNWKIEYEEEILHGEISLRYKRHLWRIAGIR